MIHEALEYIQNHLRKHQGKITGANLQDAMEILKVEIEKSVEIKEEEKKAFELFFEKLGYLENGKGKYPSLAFLLAALEFRKLNRIETVKKIGQFVQQLTRELTQRAWMNSEMFLNPLQKILNACRDSESFLSPKLANTYQFEINASKLSESEKEQLLASIKSTGGK